MKLYNIWSGLIVEQQDSVIKKIVELLNLSYEQKIGVERGFGEYKSKPVIVSKIDGEAIDSNNLVVYLTRKFLGLSEKFLKQLIIDWYNGRFKDGKYELSKPVAM